MFLLLAWRWTAFQNAKPKHKVEARTSKVSSGANCTEAPLGLETARPHFGHWNDNCKD